MGIFVPSTSIVFQIFLAARLISSFYSNISDCDEVYNYWEATHYLLKGRGFQTWEYSPEFMIRSWSYPLLNYQISSILHLFIADKILVFMLHRSVLGIISSACDAYLHSKLAHHVNPLIARYFFIFSLFATGSFISSTALLPSSLAMYATSLGFAFAMSPSARINTALSILSIGVGSLLGWPFSAILIIPFALSSLLKARGMKSALRKIGDWAFIGIACIVLISAPILLIDYYFYRKLEFVPLNIVLYNVLSAAKGKGPDIYGVEPWYFYFLNLFLNFNIVFVLALASGPITLLSIIWKLCGEVSFKANVYWKHFARLAGFYLWFIVFTLQPHKEERFMFVIYPLLCYNAAVSLYFIQKLFERTVLSKSVSMLIYSIIVVSSIISISRSYSLYENYNAPMRIYQHLYHLPNANGTLCLGKEWHRFPSHYFIPDNVNVEFLKSHFTGILPKHFHQDETGWTSGTQQIPSGMNDANREEGDRYVDVLTCNYLIDLELSQDGAVYDSKNLEPVHSRDIDNWKVVKCIPYLDSIATSRLARTLKVPGLKKSWGQYCLLKRKKTM